MRGRLVHSRDLSCGFAAPASHLWKICAVGASDQGAKERQARGTKHAYWRAGETTHHRICAFESSGEPFFTSSTHFIVVRSVLPSARASHLVRVISGVNSERDSIPILLSAQGRSADALHPWPILSGKRSRGYGSGRRQQSCKRRVGQTWVALGLGQKALD